MASDKMKEMAEDQMLPRLRQELVCTPQLYHGQPYWVYKDPLSLRYYRFNREEHFILDHLRRGITLKQLKQAHQDEFHSDQLTTGELADFVTNLMTRNLLVMSRHDRDEVLYSTGKKRRRSKWIGQITNFMFIRIPLFDPDRLLNRVMPYLKFIWTTKFFMVYLVMILTALTLVVDRWHDYTSMFHMNFFTLYNIPFLMLALYIVWGLHEFGHGLTCKNYGGEVHEMGFMFLVFNPFFYCNVTDSWMFPNKKHRMLVTAGGIMTEVFFASIATFIWYFTQSPGFLHALTFNVMLVCSFSTILFNANPLLRYDGYYILMDMIEIPNLRQRATTYVRNLFIRYVLGGEPEEVSQDHRFHLVFPLYAIAAYIYRWFIVFLIMYGVYRMLERLQLVWLGRFLVMVSVVTMLIFPLFTTGKMIVRQRRVMGITNARLLMLLGVMIAIGAVVLLWPMEQHVTLNFILEPEKVQWLRTDVAGQVNWTGDIDEGDHLEQGRLIASLTNPELEYEKIKLQSKSEQIQIQIATYQQRGETHTVEQLRSRLQSFEQDLKRVEEQLAVMQVKTPFAGKVLNPQKVFSYTQDAYYLRGMPLMMLADDSVLEAKVWVPEKTFARIFERGNNVGQKARLMLYTFPADIFTGQVAAVSSHREEHMGEFDEKLALSNKVGGEVVTEQDPKLGKEKPIESVYEVTIKLDGDTTPTSMRPYMSGRVQVECGQSTLFQWGRDSLLRLISPEVRM